jgi:HEXXH motif-containing protein
VTIYHQVPAQRVADIGSERGGPDAVRQLASIHHSKARLLIRYLADVWSGDPASAATIDLIVRAERRNPRVVAKLITDPLVSAWAMETAQRLVGATDRSSVPIAAELAQFGALAAAAAFHTGLNAEVRTHSLAGVVTLPTMGAAALASDGPTTLAVTADAVTVTGSSTSVTVGTGDPRWRELRRLESPEGYLSASLTIEDDNPYRRCYHLDPTDRLDPAEVSRWQELFAHAWHLLLRFLPVRAAELAVGLRSVVPLVPTDESADGSATAQDTFGALGLTRPRSGARLAVTLVHEFQHSKLSVLHDAVPLYEMPGRERHSVPWRGDKRPTSGLIQGVYAFLGVADTWRGLRSAPELEALATREFAFASDQVAAGLATLERSTELTPNGRVFTAGVRQAVDRLRADDPPM